MEDAGGINWKKNLELLLTLNLENQNGYEIIPALLKLTYYHFNDCQMEGKSGGKLKPEQAIMDIRHYNLQLQVDPVTKSIKGTTKIKLITSEATLISSST
jgi:hypothetical protein